MKEDELLEAWNAARNEKARAYDAFITARTAYHRARSAEDTTWKAYIRHLERPAVTEGASNG